MRTNFWYLFGLAALALILLRLRPTRRADLRDPVVLSFSLGLFLAAFGTLSKQPLLAGLIDAALGPNSAWLAADGLFLIALCAGTYWVDLMRLPDLRHQGWRLLRRWRLVALVGTLAWMVTTARLHGPTWATLERGGLDVGQSPLLLSARLTYFAYSIWALAYLSYHFYRQRQHMRDRFNYIRLTIPWAAITLALSVSALQAVATVEIFARPDLLAEIWPGLWLLITAIQAGVALLIVATFFPPAYKFISWLDKQILIHRLRRTHRLIARNRPDLALEPDLKSGQLIVRNPDTWLARLVNELEVAKLMLSRPTYEIEAPAGGVMPDVARYALAQEQGQFLHGLTARNTGQAPRVTGQTYALARWYAAVGSGLHS